MNKKAVVLKLNDKPLSVLPVLEFEDTHDYCKLVKEADSNLSKLLEDNRKVIDDLKLENAKLLAEIKYDRGQISESEYLEICGGLK